MLNPHLLLMGFFVLILAGSSTSVKAQEDKKIVRSVIISDADTIINGKSLREAKPEERIKLKKELKEMELATSDQRKQDRKVVVIQKSKSDDPQEHEEDLNIRKFYWKDGNVHPFHFDLKDKMPGGKNILKFEADTLMFEINPDSLLKEFSFKLNGLDSNMRKRIIIMQRDFDSEGKGMLRTPRAPRPPLPPHHPPILFDRAPITDMSNRKNSYSLNYNHVDKDGIPSRMSIRIGDAEKEKLKEITSSENTSPALDVKDLTLFPNFSNGKVGLSFNLEGRGTVKIKIMNSDMKLMFNDEVTSFQGNYMKQLSLSQNGVYYVAINQNTKWFVKKLIKN